MRKVPAVLVLAAAVLTAGALWAAEKAGRAERKGRGPAIADFLIKAVESLDLTADQKAKLEEIKKEAADLAKAREGVLTKEQKEARDKAMKEAREAGKDRREVVQAGIAAVKMTDEQKKSFAEIAKKGEKLREKLMNLLTDEQKAKLKEKMPKRGERKQ